MSKAWVTLLMLAGCAASAPRPTAPAREPLAAPAASPVPEDVLRITLLGTGGGPPVNLTQFGPATLVEAGGKRLLFDCGRGATLRLVQVGIPIRPINRLFLTHLHSDHVIQMPDLFLTGWIGRPGASSHSRCGGQRARKR